MEPLCEAVSTPDGDAHRSAFFPPARRGIMALLGAAILIALVTVMSASPASAAPRVRDAVDLPAPDGAEFGDASVVLGIPGYDRLNEAEKAWCIRPWNSWDCVNAHKLAEEAFDLTEELFTPGEIHNGLGDAFRHCYWSATLTMKVDDDVARTITSNHEDYPGNPSDEKAMDAHNNNIGHMVGSILLEFRFSDEKRKEYASILCEVLAWDGTLRTLRYYSGEHSPASAYA